MVGARRCHRFGRPLIESLALVRAAGCRSGAVVRALTVATRINETRLVGSLNGQRTVTVRTAGGQTQTMQFTLYVMKAEK